MLHDATTMTRMISFISLPGLVSMISGNKDIAFLGMSGTFSFQNNILSIANSSANGPYFDFTLKGNIDTKKRFMDIHGHVNPELYGISSVIGSIPIIGRIFSGNENHQGLASKSYKAGVTFFLYFRFKSVAKYMYKLLQSDKTHFTF